MNNSIARLTRRDFLKLSGLSLGGLALRSFDRTLLPEFPPEKLLGRITVGRMDIKTRPDADSQTAGVLYEDAVIPWLRETVGSQPGRINQRFVETSDGFIWGGYVQPVQNQLNDPLTKLPMTSLGAGMWVEVTVPYVDLELDNPPIRAPWLQYRSDIGLPARLFYSQIVWADQIRIDEKGQIWYRLNERYGSGDIFWALAVAFRPLIAEELTPIHPDVEEKHVVVNTAYQTMSCFEGNREVYFTRISSGALYNNLGNKVDAWSTPLGEFPIWRKVVSLPLSGGSAAAGWSLPAVGWVSLFVGSGVAIHSTYWHNNYGEPSSRGCVNAKPEDARWVFRWTLPSVSYDPGDVTVQMPGGTKVQVVER
ncbi:MAG: hypothetical protein A2X25_11755 [Chloroflexi bacterium GWB2_49_20]|nr:MAG: hypothetical protein A2X25_11755 [Chloroflexi bacterium GWB2_49_20]OGN77680.1 MAG: hypothetical protein A2X26_10025 [Chloroflexi bacterium GWC2_49_37]OGN86455.1 MAG: hypothetical protein A2X27_06180 [Chloroflexi bacterium GWD2_49_16]HBG74700.1 hypothetical protein [Anaerolineae bacterium]